MLKYRKSIDFIIIIYHINFVQTKKTFSCIVLILVIYFAIDYKNLFTCISKHKEHFFLIVKVTIKLDIMINFRFKTFRKILLYLLRSTKLSVLKRML